MLAVDDETQDETLTLLRAKTNGVLKEEAPWAVDDVERPFRKLDHVVRLICGVSRLEQAKRGVAACGEPGY